MITGTSESANKIECVGGVGGMDRSVTGRLMCRRGGGGEGQNHVVVYEWCAVNACYAIVWLCTLQSGASCSCRGKDI